MGGAVVKVLETCRKVEVAMARLYYLLAELHASQKPICGLWLKTAREEDNHTLQFAMILNRRGQAQPSSNIDAAKAEKALETLEVTVTEFREKTPSVQQALETAVTLENVLACFHADYAISFTDESHRRLFRSMMAADQDHIGALRAALDGVLSGTQEAT